jgi:hypothetical protein
VLSSCRQPPAERDSESQRVMPVQCHRLFNTHTSMKQQSFTHIYRGGAPLLHHDLLRYYCLYRMLLSNVCTDFSLRVLQHGGRTRPPHTPPPPRSSSPLPLLRPSSGFEATSIELNGLWSHLAEVESRCGRGNVALTAIFLLKFGCLCCPSFRPTLPIHFVAVTLFQKHVFFV